MAGSMSSFSKVAMEVIISVILLAAVCIPILTSDSMTVPNTAANASIINTLIGIIPVLLAVAIILGVVYSIIIRRRD